MYNRHHKHVKLNFRFKKLLKSTTKGGNKSVVCFSGSQLKGL